MLPRAEVIGALSTRTPMTTLTDKQHRNFWRKVRVNPETGCHEWTAALDGCGYGWFKLGTKMRRAHRVAYALYHTDVPEGLLVCHTCDNPRCVRKEHLFAGTDNDNSIDKVAKGRQQKVLDATLVAQVRALYSAGWRQCWIVRELGLTESHVHRIVKRKQRAVT